MNANDIDFVSLESFFLPLLKIISLTLLKIDGSFLRHAVHSRTEWFGRCSRHGDQCEQSTGIRNLK